MSHFLYQKKNKENSRLDPLTTLIKLAILPYKPKGTKLSIYNNYIYYSENNIFQFAIRTFFGDSYNDLRDMNRSLQKSVLWYSTDLKIKHLFDDAIIGLEKLKETYGETGKADAVQSYIDILYHSKNNDKDKKTEKDKKKSGENESGIEEQEFKIHNILKSSWTEDDKEIVNRYFQKIKNQSSEDINDTINSLETFLVSIHKKIEKEVKLLLSI
jgi:hypothetical protein